MARGLAYSLYSTSNITGVSTSPTLVSYTSVTDGNNVDFQHNGNGELEYTGAQTKIFIGYINMSSERDPAGQNDFRISAGLDTGSGFSVISSTRKERFLFTSNIPRPGSGNYIVTLSNGDKVRPMVDNAFGGTRNFVGLALDHFIKELQPLLGFGECHVDPVTTFDTAFSGAVWGSPVYTSVTTGNNVDFQHNGNGELEYIGSAQKIFDGTIEVTLRKASGAGFLFWECTGGIDTGSGFTEINAVRTGAVVAAQVDHQSMWCKYTTVLNTGDKVQPRIKVSGATTLRLFGLDHYLKERQL